MDILLQCLNNIKQMGVEYVDIEATVGEDFDRITFSIKDDGEIFPFSETGTDNKKFDETDFNKLIA